MNNQKRTNKVCVSNLPELSSKELRNFFEEYGEVVSVNFNSASTSGKERQGSGNAVRGKRLCAIIEYKSNEQAELARTSMHNQNFESNKLIADFYDKSEDALSSSTGISEAQNYSNVAFANGNSLGNMAEREDMSRRGQKLAQQAPNKIPKLNDASPSSYISQQPNGSKIEVKLITQDDGTQRKVIERRKKSTGSTPQKLNDMIKKFSNHGADERDVRQLPQADKGNRSLVFQKREKDGSNGPYQYVTRKTQMEESRKTQAQIMADNCQRISDKSQESLEEGEEDPKTLKKLNQRSREASIGRDAVKMDFERPVSKNFVVKLDGHGTRNSEDGEIKRSFAESGSPSKKGYKSNRARGSDVETPNNCGEGKKNPTKMKLIRSAIDDYYTKGDHVNYLKLMEEFDLWDIPEFSAKEEELRSRSASKVKTLAPPPQHPVLPPHNHLQPLPQHTPPPFSPIMHPPSIFPSGMRMPPHSNIPMPMNHANFPHQPGFPPMHPHHASNMIPSPMNMPPVQSQTQMLSTPSKKKEFELTSEERKRYHGKLHEHLKRKHEGHYSEYEKIKSRKRKSTKTSHEKHEIFKCHLKHAHGPQANFPEQQHKKLKVDPAPTSTVQPPHSIFQSPMMPVDYFYDAYMNKVGVSNVMNHPPMMQPHYSQHTFYRGPHPLPEDFIPPPPQNMMGMPKWGIPYPEPVNSFQTTTSSVMHHQPLIQMNYSGNGNTPSGLSMNAAPMTMNPGPPGNSALLPSGGGAGGFLTQPVQSQFNYNFNAPEVYASKRGNVTFQESNVEYAQNKAPNDEAKGEQMSSVNSKREEKLFSVAAPQVLQEQPLVIEGAAHEYKYEKETEMKISNVAVYDVKGENAQEVLHIEKLERKEGLHSSKSDMRKQKSRDKIVHKEEEMAIPKIESLKEEVLAPSSALQNECAQPISEVLPLTKVESSKNNSFPTEKKYITFQAADNSQMQMKESEILERNNSFNSASDQQEDLGNSENSEKLNKLRQNKKYKDLLNSIIRKGGKMEGIKLKKEN